MRFVLGVVAVAIGGAGMALHAGTTINVSSQVITSSVKRFGMDLGSINYYDSGEMMKELLYTRNPGFEGQIYQSVVRVGAGGATYAIEDTNSTQWPSGFWDGATYEFVYGTAKGRTGTIVHSVAPNRSQTPNDPTGSTIGSTYNFADSGVVPAVGDYLIVRKSQLGDGGNGTGAATYGGWGTTLTGGGTITSEDSDLPPGTLGKQCVRLTATSSGQQAILSGFFDTYSGVSFVQLNGHFQLSFQAKGVGGANGLLVQVRRGSGAYWINQTLALTTSWASYALTFAAAETGTAVGPVQITFTPVNQSAVLLDEVSLHQTDGDPTNTTAFRDAVVNALKTYHPGILRYPNYEHLGDSLDNQLAPMFGKQRSGYSTYKTGQNNLFMNLQDFLVLCEFLGADPWYSFPDVFDPIDLTHLMEYLGGDAVTTTYGAKRAALGHPTPWTSVFSQIHLEFGNENWNSAYHGGAFLNPVAYGVRATELIGTAKSSPYYNSAIFNFIIGGQATYTALTQQIQNNCTNHDRLCLAPYMGSFADNYATNEQWYGSLFAEPEWWSRAGGYMLTNYNNAQASPHPVPLAVYEVNVNTPSGTVPQSYLDAYLPSLGSGLAVTDNMLLMLHDLHIREQGFLGLQGYRFTRTDGTTGAIWSAVRDMGVTDRRRPQYLACQMANAVLSGNMVDTGQSGDNPTWNQSASDNRVGYNGAHYIQSYAFSNGQTKGLVVFNLSRTDSLGVSYSGPNAPAGSVTMQQLTSANITDNNENVNNVAIATNALTAFDPLATLTLPPYSMTTLSWTQPPIDVWRYNNFGTTSNTGSAADLATPASDGVSNLMKYALNLSATASASGALPVITTTTSGGQKYLMITVNKNSAATDIAYTVEVSGDLQNWFSGPTYTTILTNTPTTLVARDNTPMGAGGKRFIRLHVTRQ